MTEETSPAAAQRRLNPAGLRARPARDVAAPDRSADAGAVLRRPQPDGRLDPRRGPGPVRPVRPSYIVDTADLPPTPPRADRAPAPGIVDITDGGDGDAPGRGLPRMTGSVDGSAPPRPRGPGEGRSQGPSGPDADRVRRLREAKKGSVAARARARGVDPGAGSVSTEAGLTRSEKTQNQYLARGRMLMRRYGREIGLASISMDSVNPIEFVNWLFSLKPSLKQTTWRPYRQAAKAILSILPHDDTETAMAMLDADLAETVPADEEVREKRAEAKTRAQGLPRRTSSLKEKRFPKADFDRTVAYLRAFSRSGLASTLIDWLVAGITTGLRPVEWQATELEVREDAAAPGGRWVWLYVINAKATNGRGNGVVRTLDLSHFGDATLESVRRMSERGVQWLEDGVYDSMQSQCSQLLYSVCDRIFSGRGKTYSLYTLRHQFVANAKTYHKPEAVSALVGHVVTDTAQQSYAKRYSSWGPEDIADRAEPVPEEVSTVRQRLRFFEERLKLQRAAGLIPEGS